MVVYGTNELIVLIARIQPDFIEFFIRLCFYGNHFKRQCQQKPPELESWGSADRLGTNFFGFLIQ
jgi:hypothetical protein